MNINKFILPAILGVLLLASGVFNVVQYNDAKVTKEKLALFETHFGTYEKLSESLKQAEEAKNKREHTLTIYTKTNVPESQIFALKSLLENQSSVQSVKYVSAAQALADFKVRHQDDQLTLQALNELGANPLSGSLEITISDPAQKSSLMNFIQSNDRNSIVDRVNS